MPKELHLSSLHDEGPLWALHTLLLMSRLALRSALPCEPRVRCTAALAAATLAMQPPTLNENTLMQMPVQPCTISAVSHCTYSWTCNTGPWGTPKPLVYFMKYHKIVCGVASSSAALNDCKKAPEPHRCYNYSCTVGMCSTEPTDAPAAPVAP